jgi:nitrous oxidase accessory protein
MTLKGAGIDKTILTHAPSWKPTSQALPDPEMKMEGLNTDAYLIRLQGDASGFIISDGTLHGPQLHGALFAE